MTGYPTGAIFVLQLWSGFSFIMIPFENMGMGSGYEVVLRSLGTTSLGVAECLEFFFSMLLRKVMGSVGGRAYLRRGVFLSFKLVTNGDVSFFTLLSRCESNRVWCNWKTRHQVAIYCAFSLQFRVILCYGVALCTAMVAQGPMGKGSSYGIKLSIGIYSTRHIPTTWRCFLKLVPRKSEFNRLVGCMVLGRPGVLKWIW